MPIPWHPPPSGPSQPPHPSPPSYPSSFGTDSDIDSGSDISSDDESELDAMIQEEWEESLRQFELVVSIVVIPYFGKWFGRKWAFWAYERYQTIGIGKAFFGLL